MSQTDVWSQMGAIAPTGAPRHLAYADGPAVGFDVRMPLPARCLTCGGEEHLTRVPHRIRVEGGIEVFLAQHLRGDRVDGLVRAGDRIELSLPHCAVCRRQQQRARRLAWIARLAPIWIIVAVVLSAAIAESLVVPVLLASIAGATTAAVMRASLDGKYRVEVERIDGDGIARIAPVHPDAAHAVLVAAGMERA